jgi:hypothetical protein
VDDTFQAVESGDEEVLEVEALQILDGRGLPEVEAAGLLRRRDQGQLDAGAEAEDAVAGDLEDSILLIDDFVFLPAAAEERRDGFRVQQETQTVCPFQETGFLPGKRARPRWASTCFLNSLEEIERREDKISRIRASLISGRTGEAVGHSVFIRHEDRAKSGG